PTGFPKLKNRSPRPDIWSDEGPRAGDPVLRPLGGDDARPARPGADPPRDVQPLRPALRAPRFGRSGVLLRARVMAAFLGIVMIVLSVLVLAWEIWSIAAAADEPARVAATA